MSVQVLAKCPATGCRAVIRAEMSQDVATLHSLLLSDGWHFDQQKREWRCPMHRLRPAPKLTADARLESGEKKKKRRTHA